MARWRLRNTDEETSTGAWWAECDLPGGWVAALRLVPDRGLPLVGEMRIFPGHHTGSRPPGEWDVTSSIPGRGVTKRVMMGLKLSDFPGWLRHQIEAHESARGDLFYAPESPFLRSALTSTGARAAARPGRRGHDPRFLAEVAQMYVSLVERGDTRPYRSLPSLLGCSPSTAKGWVQLAREQDMIRATKPGRASGKLSPKAKALLAERKEGVE